MTLRFVSACAAGFVLLLTPVTSFAADRGPSMPEERKQALDYIHDLRTNPLGANAQQERSWLLKWLADIPDVTVHVCMIFDKLPKPDKKDSASIIFAQMAAQAEFILTHPEQKDDRQAELLSGARGALQVYEVLLGSNPKDRQPYLDDLIQRRDAGTLSDFVKEREASACKN